MAGWRTVPITPFINWNLPGSYKLQSEIDTPSSMTRQHFEALAEMVAEQKSEQVQIAMAIALIPVCWRFNTSFSVTTFLEKCGDRVWDAYIDNPVLFIRD